MRYLILLLALPVAAERITVPLRDPSRPATVRLSTVNGSIQVRAHAAREVIVSTSDEGESPRPGPDGMKEIPLRQNGLRVEEENNVITVKPRSPNGSYVVYAPANSSLQLKSVNARELRIEGIEGEINAETVNGSIQIAEAAGPVVAHALNGRLSVHMKDLAAGKPMSLSTMNGRIELILPGSANADLTIHNQRGRTYSDFDLALTQRLTKKDSGREGGPRYELTLEQTATGRLNGGGTAISLRSMNGTIHIRKAQ